MVASGHMAKQHIMNRPAQIEHTSEEFNAQIPDRRTKQSLEPFPSMDVIFAIHRAT